MIFIVRDVMIGSVQMMFLKEMMSDDTEQYVYY